MMEDTLLEDELITVTSKESLAKKKKIKRIIAGLLLVNILLILVIWPIASFFYTLPLSGRLIYLTLTFGQPILLAFVAVVFASFIALISGTRQFRHKLGKPFRTIYVSFMGILFISLIFLGGITSSMERNPFDLILYNDVIGTVKNTEEIRTGNFHAYNVIYIRREMTQSEHHSNGSVTLYNIDWLSNNEYQIYRADHKSMQYGNDTVRIKIIDFNDEYIEYCGGYSEYGTYGKMYRDK